MFVTTLKRNVLCARETSSQVPVWSVISCFRFLSRMCNTVSGLKHFTLTYQKAHV